MNARLATWAMASYVQVKRPVHLSLVFQYKYGVPGRHVQLGQNNYVDKQLVQSTHFVTSPTKLCCCIL